VAEGEFHESLNLAALWKLPVLFLCENNRYAMGTALERSESETDVHAKAKSYKMPAVVVDGMDVVAVEAAACDAAERIRHGDGPHLLELRTYRFRAHSMFDPELYRDKKEVEAWKASGPIVTFTDKLKEQGLVEDDDIAGIEAAIEEEVAVAVEFAEAGTREPVENLTKDVYTGTVQP